MSRPPVDECPEQDEQIGHPLDFVDHHQTFERPKNESFRYNAAGRILRALAPSGAAMNRLVDLGQRLTPKALEPWVKRLIVTGVPGIDAESRQYLLDYFREPNDRLRQITGLQLDRWSA